MKNNLYIMYGFLLFVLVGCRKESIAPLLTEAERLMEYRADSALLLLETVAKPEKLTAKEYATWCLLVTQARDKNYVEHTSDSVINRAVRYFAKHKDPYRQAQSYYCKGRVLSDLNLSEEALEAYLQAREAVQQTTAYGLQARICNHLGTLYERNQNKLKGLDSYKEAYWAYQQCQDTIGLVSALHNIGYNMMFRGALDSASLYLNQALELATLGKVESQQVAVLSALGTLYEEKGEYELALALNQKALTFSKSDRSKASCYYAIGGLYEKLHRLDSALWYGQKALRVDDLYIRCSANRLLYKVYRTKGEADSAFAYNEQFLLLRDSIEQQYDPQRLAQVEALYNKERLENEHNRQLQAVKERNYKWGMGGLLLLVAVLIICWILHNRLIRQQQTNREVQRLLDESQTHLLESLQVVQEKNGQLLRVQQELEVVQISSTALITEQNEQISQLQEQRQQLESSYSKQLGEMELVKNRLLDEKERLLLEIKGVIEQNEKLHQNQQAQLNALKLSKQQQADLEQQLRQRLEQFCQEKEVLTCGLEQIRAEKERTIQEQRKQLEETVKACQRYETWTNTLIQRNSCLQKTRTLIVAQPWKEAEWTEFLENFESVFPGFVERFLELADFPIDMQDRYLRIACLTRLGVKTSKVALLIGLGADMTTKSKAEIRKLCFPMEKTNYLDQILKRWY